MSKRKALFQKSKRRNDRSIWVEFKLDHCCIFHFLFLLPSTLFNITTLKGTHVNKLINNSHISPISQRFIKQILINEI